MKLPLQYKKFKSGCLNNMRRGVRAFTLLEIVIALSIFLLMVIGIYSSWSQIHRSTRVGLERAAENQRKRVAIRALEQSLGSVKYFLANETNYTFFAEMDGRSSYLSFVSHLPNNFPRSSIFPYQPMRRVRFSVEDGTNGLGRLVLRQQPFLYEANIDEDENPLILANDLDSFYVEFLPDGEDAEWQDYWDMTNDIPVMARVSLEYKYENRSDPEIVTKLIQLASSPVPAEFQLGRTGSNRSRSSGRSSGDSRDRAGRGDSRSRSDMGRGSSRGGSSRGPVSRVPSRSGRSAGGGGGKSGGR
jgi:type II secretion system protein J